MYWLYGDPEEVIRATRSPLNEFYEGRGWRPTYLSIGETAMGDQYLIDAARTPSPVFCLGHETHEVEEEFPDLAAFVAYWTREVAVAKGAVEPSRPRRWWRFWG